MFCERIFAGFGTVGGLVGIAQDAEGEAVAGEAFVVELSQRFVDGLRLKWHHSGHRHSADAHHDKQVACQSLYY